MRQVNKNDAMGGGIVRTISRINSSEMDPGPLGIFATKPNAEAP
jgi:hypothetical protein